MVLGPWEGRIVAFILGLPFLFVLSWLALTKYHPWPPQMRGDIEATKAATAVRHNGGEDEDSGDGYSGSRVFLVLY
jgi:hypothetical protein